MKEEKKSITQTWYKKVEFNNQTLPTSTKNNNQKSNFGLILLFCRNYWEFLCGGHGKAFSQRCSSVWLEFLYLPGITDHAPLFWNCPMASDEVSY